MRKRPSQTSDLKNLTCARSCPVKIVEAHRKLLVLIS